MHSHERLLVSDVLCCIVGVRVQVRRRVTVFEGNRKSEGKLSSFNSSLVVQLFNRGPMFIDEISGHRASLD